MTNAQAALESAQLRLEKLLQGPSEEDVRAAQIAVDRAHTQLAQLRDAPRVSPQDLENARLDVEKAKINYENALRDATGTPRSEAAIRSAIIALQRVQNTYTKLQSLAPSPWAMRQAEQAIEAAELGLQRLGTLDQFDIQQAELNIRKAQAQLDSLAGAAYGSGLGATPQSDPRLAALHPERRGGHPQRRSESRSGASQAR